MLIVDPIYPQQKAIALLQGYDSARGLALNTAIEGTVTSERNSDGTSDVRVCETYEAVLSALNLTNTGKISLAEVGNISTRRQLDQELQISENDVTIVVRVTIEAGTTQLSNAVIKPGVAQPSSVEAALDFYRTYGDTYVNSVTAGCEYYAVFSCNCLLVGSKTELVNDLHAEGVYDGMSLDASLTQRLEVVTKKYRYQWRFTQRMVGVMGLAYPTMDTCIDFALKFPVATAGRINGIFGFEVAGYEHVLSQPKYFDQIRVNREILFQPPGSTATESVVKAQSRLQSLKAQTDTIQGFYNAYGEKPDQQFTEKRDEIISDLNKCNAVFAAFANNPTLAFPPGLLSFPSLKFGRPELVCKQRLSGKFGGDSGVYFRDIVIPDSLPIFGRLAKLQFFSGSYVNRFCFTYQPFTGHPVEIAHGAGGNTLPLLVISPGDFVKKIRVYAGIYVDYLEITLNSGGKREVGSRPSSEDKLLTMFDADRDGKFVGFEGRCDAWMDMLIAVSMEFLPVHWTLPVLEEVK